MPSQWAQHSGKPKRALGTFAEQRRDRESYLSLDLLPGSGGCHRWRDNGPVKGLGQEWWEAARAGGCFASEQDDLDQARSSFWDLC